MSTSFAAHFAKKRKSVNISGSAKTSKMPAVFAKNATCTF